MSSCYQIGIEPEFVLFIDCPKEELERRILNRNQVLFALVISQRKLETFVSFASFTALFSLGCLQGRDDDNIDTIRKRFEVFQESTLPVVQYYEKRGKLRKVTCIGGVLCLCAKICNIVE
jgi:UMP-CMP kinase